MQEHQMQWGQMEEAAAVAAEKKNNNEYFERLISLFFLQIAFTSTRKLWAALF